MYRTIRNTVKWSESHREEVTREHGDMESGESWRCRVEEKKKTSEGEMEERNSRYIVTVYVGSLSEDIEALSVEASKHTTAEEIVCCIAQKLGFPNAHEFELAEVIGNSFGQECKERRISSYESPVALKLLWPKIPDPAADGTASGSGGSSTSSKTFTNGSSSGGGGGGGLVPVDCYRFCLREKLTDSLWNESFVKDTQFIRDYFYRFHFQPKDKEYPDLCQLPDLNESTLLESLRSRFNTGHIYTYVGSILIAVNPFKFHPIYNPKYVKLYQNRRREELPPHIFAIADSAYHTMLKDKRNQCIVISGESGSGKTESTNFLLHHLTALSQKGTHGSGVEQTILSAGPVLEAFGNAKTAHNNNSSRFGKFIQVSYKENGMVHGSIVQKFLLEKSRICCQAIYERNYHVFYYLLAGASDTERELFNLLPPECYHYLNQSGCYTLDGVDESYEFSRLKQSMEMVGFGADKQRKLFSVLSAVLLLGNVKFLPKKSSYRDESVVVKNLEVVSQISSLLRVTQETLLASLTSKRARVSGEMLVINYRMVEAIAARDAMAKCLYGALFDWIVMQLNHALLSKKSPAGNDFKGKSIGVLDIFGFEDFDNTNSFEQFCINYANEHLQHYFNQHVFKYEQEEYKKEGIKWTNIEFLDNSPCLSLIESKPNGLICILDDQCNFPGATSETLLQKFNSVYKEHKFYEAPQKREAAFIICHYAGKVKYQVSDFREKNMDLMRHDIVSVLKNSSCAFVRELVGVDPVAVFRWAILRAFFRAYSAFNDAGRRRRANKENGVLSQGSLSPKERRSSIGKDQPVRKNRSFRSQALNSRNFKNLRSVKTLAGHLATIGVSNKHYNPRKQPISVSQQFQQSLHSLMVTLNQANPFFIRCIKSNSDKIPNEFDDAIVQRQLRYTGMLETVRIRQAGYNVRLNFDEFVHLYRILLPKGLKSERRDVEAFLHSVNLNPLNYQLGEHKVFLRETEKIKLDYFLHQQILKSIVCIQRWYRSILERRHFLRVQQAVVSIQSYVRMFLVQKNLRMMHLAATYIQKTWRGFKVRRWYQNLKSSCVQFQARVRGNIVRENWARLLEERRKENLTNQARNAAAAELASVERSKEFPDRESTRGSGEESFYNITRRTPELTEEILYRTTESDGAFLSAYDETTTNSSYLERGFSPRSKWEDADDNANIYESPPRELKGALKQSASSKSPFQRAKKTIKTIIIPGGGTLKTKPEKYEATVLENPSEDEDDYLPPSFSTLPAATSRLRRDQGKLKPSPGTFLTSPEDESGASRKALALRLTRSLQTVGAEKMTDTKTFGGTPLHLSESFPYERELTPPGGEKGNAYEGELSLRRQSLDKQIRRQGQVLDEMPPRRNGLDAFRSSGSNSRRESDERTAMYSSEPRRSSRESEQNYYGSPSLSSQESLAFLRGSIVSGEFKESKSASRLAEERESRLSTSASEFSLDSSMNVMGSANQRRKSKDSTTKEPGAVKFTLPETLVREVRRSRSVSVSRDVKGGFSTDGSGNDQNQENISREDPRSIKLKKFGYHILEKVSKFHRGDSCGVCKKTMHAVLAQGQRCTECRTYFHDKCISNGSIANSTCEQQNKNHMLKITTSKSETMGRKVKRKESKHITEVNKSNFSLTGTSEFTDATDQIISDVNELQAMQEFISEKILQVENMDGKKSSAVDKVFEQALREFKESLVSSFSVASKQGGIMLSITYKDLIAYFAKIMETVCKQKGIGSDFPTNMGVNALRGFLNEFMSTHRNRMEEKPKIAKSRKKLKRSKRQKVEEFINYINHTFVPMVVYIPTACEICSSFIMWPIERGIVCQKCKLACHKKCYPKLQIECGDGQGGQNRGSDKGVFGVPLTSLLSGGGSVPLIIEKLIYLIETNGIKQEGIYRKSGVSSRVKELKNEINEGKEVQWDSYNIHVYTSVLKSFFRDLPEPLLTYELYDELLRAADLSLPEGRIHTIFALLQKLPNPNYDLMERLIFHLVRVAHYEDSNRMNANSLAIVFAPCVLRTNKNRQVLESLTDVSRQTLCIETIIGEQLKKYKSTLTNIEKVDSESMSFIFRLSSVRKSKIMAGKKGISSSGGGIQPNTKSYQVPQDNPAGASSMTVEEEEAYLSRHLNHLKQEKAMLTSALPSLSRAPSEDEMLSTDPEMESSRGSIDDLRKDPGGRESHTYGKHSIDALDICHECLSPQCRGTSSSTLLPHHTVKTKNRGPLRKPPSRFVRNQFHAINFGEDEFDDTYDFEDDLNETRGLSDDDDEDGAMVV